MVVAQGAERSRGVRKRPGIRTRTGDASRDQHRAARLFPRGTALLGSLVVLEVVKGCSRCLFVERLTIGDAAAEEFRPGRNRDVWVDLLWKRCPKVRVVPAKAMPRAVPMPSNRDSKLRSLDEKLIAGHVPKVLVHRSILCWDIVTAQGSVSGTAQVAGRAP